ncbi:MAG: ATP-binding cassette domain-containing protein [Kiritimatiellaceae bacterium]|nr:ATP-binding cassette domain-containing protein [Kiritimatiellaceae bacterium]
MIRIENITVRAGGFSIAEVSLHVPAGCYGALMGRTGSGKTTLLEAIIGLKPVESGKIFLAGNDVTNASPAARGIGYVPQDGALFSTMTVREHLAFALEIRHEKREAVEQRVQELAELLGITHLLHRRPFGLSGGERQRVALGRALSFRPQILLLDEPLSAVDEGTRSEMYELLRRVQVESGVTALHITHNPVEARELADAVFVLKDGKITREES